MSAQSGGGRRKKRGEVVAEQPASSEPPEVVSIPEAEKAPTPKPSVPRVEKVSSAKPSVKPSAKPSAKPSVSKEEKIQTPKVSIPRVEPRVEPAKKHKKRSVQPSPVIKRKEAEKEKRRLKAEEDADNKRIRALNLSIPPTQFRLSPIYKKTAEKKTTPVPTKSVKSSAASQVFPSVKRSSPRRSSPPRKSPSKSPKSLPSSRSVTPSPSPVRRPRRRRESPSSDEESEDNTLSVEEESIDREPPTEEELQDEYRALIKRMRRVYPYLDLELPPLGTLSKRLRKMYRNAMEEVGDSEGLEKYKLLMVIGFGFLEVFGKKIGMPCDDYAELQMKQIHNYNSMLIEFGERDYFGFARSWPVEARLIGLMLVNMGCLVVGRLLFEPDTLKKIITVMAGSRGIPAPNIDVPPPQDPDGRGGEAQPSSGAGGSAASAANPLAGLLGGGGGGLNGMISMIMNAFSGGTMPPPRDRSDQAGPSYQRRRRRGATE